MVAQEVRKLANRSAKAAQNTSDLIKHSIKDVQTGTESTDLVVSAMKVINDCIQEIKTLMDEIAAASVQQSEMIVSDQILEENGKRNFFGIFQFLSSYI